MAGKKKTEVSVNTKTVLELDNFNPVKAELIAFIDERKELKLKSLDDKEGYEAIRKARIEIKNKRTKEVEPERKRIVKPANEFVDKVNGAANEIKDIMQLAEKALQAEEDKYTAEKERQKREKEQAEQKMVQDRINKLAEWDYHVEYIYAKMLSEEQFEEHLQQARKVYEEKKAKAEQEEKERKEKEEEQRKLAVINEAKSIILNAKTHEELEKIFDFIETRNLDLNEFQNDIDAKKDAINEAKKIEDEKIKQQEEKQKLLEEKITLAIEKIGIIQTLEELENYFEGFAAHEYVKEKLTDAYNKRKIELMPTPEAKTKPEQMTNIRAAEPIKGKNKVQQAADKAVEYKKFLQDLGVNDEAIKNKQFIVDTNKETKTVTVYGIVGTFNF